MGKALSKSFLQQETDQVSNHQQSNQSSSSSQSCDQNLSTGCQFQNNPIRIPNFQVKPTPFTHNKLLELQIQTTIPKKQCSWMQVFYHPQLFNSILDYLTQQQDASLYLCSRRMQSEIFLRRIQRIHNWSSTLLTLQRKIISDIYFFYSQSQQESQHSLDLDRTFSLFPSEEDLEGQVSKLDKVMRALSFSIPYFQGLNSIVVVLLFYYDQNKSYWISRYLLSKTMNIHHDQEVYDEFMMDVQNEIKFGNQKVFQHLIKNDFQIQYFAMRWVMGLFSYDIDKQTLMYLWDLICFHGLAALKWFIVGIFQIFKDIILQLYEDQINQLLKSNFKKLFSRKKGQDIIKYVKKKLIEKKFKVEQCLRQIIPINED